MLAVIFAGAAFVIGISWGHFVARGPDASGYVSQADLWSRGILTMPTPEWAQGGRWNNAVYSSAPVGYRPGTHPSILVPTYSPGLPMTMAVFQRVAGRDAVYYAVPAFGTLAIWATYLLGRSVAGGWAGAIAALLLLCSPPFLWFLIQPMSDVPATACWALALVFAYRSGYRNAIFAGLVTAAGMLVRPNLAPLAAIPALLLLVTPEFRFRRLLLFAAGAGSGALVIAALNSYWYGSPFLSGYGSLRDLYVLERIGPNVRQYGRWLVRWQTPLIFLGFAAPFLARFRSTEWRQITLVTVVYPLAVLGMYAAYLTFDHWTYLRFLTPAFPAVFAGVGALLVRTVRHSYRPRAAAAVALTVVGFLGYHGWSAVLGEGLFRSARDAQRFVAIATSFAGGVPRGSIVVSLAESGTLHFYTGVDVLRWETIAPTQLDSVLSYLREHGHPLYFVGDDFEVSQFKRSFGGTRTFDSFDERRLGNVRTVNIYDLSAPLPPPAALLSVTFNPPSVPGGTVSTGTITLTRATPPAGASVDLTSSDETVVKMTRNISVSPFERTVTFTAQTFPVRSTSSATVTAQYAQTMRSAVLEVTPASPAQR